MPFDQLAAATGADAKLRKLIKNMVYVGVAAQLLSIDMESVEKTVRKQFAKKVKAAELNLNAVRVGFDYAASTLTKQDPYVVEPMNATDGKIIIDGNAAAAMGAMFAGVTVVAWYPITPSSSVVENLIDLMKQYRVEKDGKASFAIVQAEDELAAIGMVLGAGWAGARAMTASSGPGHLADGGVCRAWLLRRDSRRHLRHSAHGALDRAADAHLAGGPDVCRGALAWRHQACDPAAGDSEGVLRVWHGGVRSCGAVADAGLCALGPRSGHEQLDVGAV